MSDKKKMRPKVDPKKKVNKEKILPGKNPATESQVPGSMSEGNLSNNRYGRTRRRTPHRKTFITGSDDDGQAV